MLVQAIINQVPLVLARYGAREGFGLQLTLVSHRRLVKLASFTSIWMTSSATPLSTSCSTSWRGSAPASTLETSATPTSSSSRRTWKVRTLPASLTPFLCRRLLPSPPPPNTTNLVDAVAGEVEDSLGKWPSALGTVVVMEAKYIPFLLFKVMPLLPASTRHEPKTSDLLSVTLMISGVAAVAHPQQREADPVADEQYPGLHTPARLRELQRR